MLNLLTKLGLPLLLSGFALSSTASAQEWGLRFGKQTRSGHISVGVGSRGVDFRGHSRSGHSGFNRSRRCAPVHVHGASCTSGGHYRTVRDKVWVPGRSRQVWVPARYETYIDACGFARQRLVCAGRYEYVQEPGCYEYRERQVWVPRTYSCGHSSITRRW